MNIHFFKHFLIIRCGKVLLSSKVYPVGILTDKTCQWFWDELNCRVSRTGAIPTTLNQLRAKFVYEWNNLPQNYVQRYVMSMRRRCLADQDLVSSEVLEKCEL